MKTLKRLLILALALIMSMSTLVGCNRESFDNDIPDDVSEDKIITVERIKNGRGDDFTQELKKVYEDLYPGYYVNLKPSTNDMQQGTVIRALYRGYEKSGVDVYYTGNITNEQIGKNNDYTKDQDGRALVQDLTADVWNQPAENFYFDEAQNKYVSLGVESKTIGQKLNPEFLKWVKYDVDNAIYAMPIFSSASGLSYNKTTLATYGYTEGPVTTDELIEMVNSIYLGKMKDGSAYPGGTSEDSNIDPFTYYTGSQYGGMMFYTAIAQQDLTFFEELKRFSQWSEGTDGEDVWTPNMTGYEMYNPNGDGENFLPGLEMLYFSYDTKLAVTGVTTATLDTAQAKLVSKTGNRAVFMWNGEWVLNEVVASYPNASEDLGYVNFPLSSTIGDECFPEIADEKARDAKLAEVVKLVDQNKTIDEIVSAAGVERGDAERIANARGIYFERGVEGGLYVAHDSPKKEQAYKFIRLFAADGAADIIADKAHANSIYAEGENTVTNSKFINAASKMPVNAYAHPIRWEALGMREQIKKGSIFYTQGELLNKLWEEGVSSMYNKGAVLSGKTWENVYGSNASARLQAVYNLFKDNWDAALTSGGLK